MSARPSAARSIASAARSRCCVPPLPLALGMKEAAAAAAGVGGAAGAAGGAGAAGAAAGSLGATALKAGTTALVIGAAGVAGFSGLGGGSPEPESAQPPPPASEPERGSAAARPGKAEPRRRAAARANVRQNPPGPRRSERVQDPAAAAGAAGATSCRARPAAAERAADPAAAADRGPGRAAAGARGPGVARGRCEGERGAARPRRDPPRAIDDPLAGRHSQRAVQAQHLAVEHRCSRRCGRRASRTRPGARAAAGKGICAPSAWRDSSGSPASSGVSNRPGAMVQTRMPSRARSRAAGSVSPATPPFEAA